MFYINHTIKMLKELLFFDVYCKNSFKFSVVFCNFIVFMKCTIFLIKSDIFCGLHMFIPSVVGNSKCGNSTHKFIVLTGQSKCIRVLR